MLPLVLEEPTAQEFQCSHIKAYVLVLLWKAAQMWDPRVGSFERTLFHEDFHPQTAPVHHGKKLYVVTELPKCCLA